MMGKGQMTSIYPLSFLMAFSLEGCPKFRSPLHSKGLLDYEPQGLEYLLADQEATERGMPRSCRHFTGALPSSRFS